MKKCAPWQAPVLSWFSGDLYRSAVSDWKGIAFGYLYLLIAVLYLMICTRMVLLMDEAVFKLEPALDQFPLMTIKDGELSIDKPSPYMVKGPDGLGTFVVFDTSEDAKNYPDVPFILTKHHLIIQSGTGRQATAQRAKVGSTGKEFPINTMSDGTTDSASVKRFFHGVPMVLGIGMFLVFMPLSFLFIAVWSLIFALIAQAMASSRRLNLSFAQSVRLAVTAFTPALTAVALIFMAAPDFVPFGLLLGFCLAIGYLAFGILANGKETATAPSPGPEGPAQEP